MGHQLQYSIATVIYLGQNGKGLNVLLTQVESRPAVSMEAVSMEVVSMEAVSMEVHTDLSCSTCFEVVPYLPMIPFSTLEISNFTRILKMMLQHMF